MGGGSVSGWRELLAGAEDGVLGAEDLLEAVDGDILDGELAVDGKRGGVAGGLADDHVLRLHADRGVGGVGGG